MTFVTILNFVLAIAVIVAVVGLLGWAIASSPRDHRRLGALRRPARSPRAPRPQGTPARQSAARSRSPRREPLEPTAG